MGDDRSTTWWEHFDAEGSAGGKPDKHVVEGRSENFASFHFFSLWIFGETLSQVGAKL
jgi:hypothetical protein